MKILFKTLSCTVIVIGLLHFSACKKHCRCDLIWDPSVTYVSGNSVSYNNKCYVAIAQGRGIVPGPWMQNGNDIWKECVE